MRWSTATRRSGSAWWTRPSRWSCTSWKPWPPAATSDDPKVKSEIAAQVLPLIEDVSNPIERDTYRQRLARLLRVDERRLPGEGGFTRRPARRASAKPIGAAQPWSRCAAPPPAATPWKPLPWASCCAVPTCSTGRPRPAEVRAAAHLAG